MTRLADRPASPTPPNPNQPPPSARKVYDRSSFEGDFLVTVPDQSPNDFERHAPESQFCEYLDGTVYMPSPVSAGHQRIVIFLTSLLDLYRESLDLDFDLLTGPAVLRLTENRQVEPDVQVLPAQVPGARPLLVVEVVSPSHRAYDLELKSGFYREGLLPEVWYVDSASRTVFRDLQTDAGPIREAIREGRVFASRIPGFWIDVEWLWGDPPPKRGGCLASILAEPPA